MDRADVSFWLSIASFGISAILGVVRLVEFSSTQRVRIKAEASLTSLEEIGNTITLLNASSVPVTISYFELAWTERRKFFGIPIPFMTEEVATDSPIDPPDGYAALILPHQTHSLLFREQYHFDWGVRVKHDIYLKLWLVGKGGPIWLWITGPSKYR
ncbi:hypothetical protein V1291_005035 [Nitrobacteraceae bacterium AZCC 1564]